MATPKAFDASNPDTYTPQAVQKLKSVDIIQVLNQIKPCTNPFAKIPRKRLDEARRDLVLCLAVGLANTRRQHDDYVLARTQMFACESDGASDMRPSVGLKRTFLPRLVQGYGGSPDRSP
ncbi:small capsid protein [Spheniscid alphaherpesvirus 1]|uniref:Small capsomere-interacting protein n=1 Tax=Spheniscid alphaherpesvirus 1 TaxID=2560777 RepID=A0A1R3TF86_9ALPH|nr:small capsid protein [Spheniscid alphaherpesvirus 1]